MNIRSLSPFISSTLLVKSPLSTPLSPVVRATILFAIAFFAFCIGYGLPHLFQQGFHAKLKNILYSRGDINQLIQFLKNNPLKLNEVQDLRLNHFKTVRDNDLKILASLCPCLRSLEISNCDEITDDGIENLQVLRSLRSLSLRAGCTKITDKGIEHLKHHTGLNFFELGNCHQITDAGLKPLENLSFLSHLYLSDTPLVTDNGLESIGKLINLKSLTLNFLGQMTDQGLNHLSPLKNLKHLNLSKSNITDLGLFSLFREIKGVTSLKIEFCDQISNTQPEFLSSLSLDKLEISDCMQMTDDSLNEKPSHSLLVKLASIVPVHLPLGGAKSLKLTGFPQLTDVGIKHLKEALLKKLRLEMCHNITGSGLQDLNQLKQISLYDCNSMTDIALDNLKNLKNLSHVDLYKCPNISQSARDNFSDYFRSGFLNTGLFTRNKFYHS